jgi:hypothetical protein
MSNPARTVDIGLYADKLYGENPGFLAIALTLSTTRSASIPAIIAVFRKR